MLEARQKLTGNLVVQLLHEWTEIGVPTRCLESYNRCFGETEPTCDSEPDAVLVNKSR